LEYWKSEVERVTRSGKTVHIITMGCLDGETR
jgi:hypothetical protein